MSDDNWGPWIGWNGGECPVDDYDEVQYVWHGSGGVIVAEETAHNIRWGLGEVGGGKYFMSSYRVKKEPVVEERQEVVDMRLYGKMTLGEMYKSDYHQRLITEVAQCTYTDGKLTKIHWEAEE